MADVEAFFGEIRLFAGNYAPKNWAFCDGQILPISEYTQLFALLGNTYPGGDGRTTFALPDLRGRIPLHFGEGPNLTNRPLGQVLGTESVALTRNQIPAHRHAPPASSNTNLDTYTGTEVVGNTSAGGDDIGLLYDNNETEYVDMGANAVGETGGGETHSNLMPTLCIHFIIRVKLGLFPSRN